MADLDLERLKLTRERIALMERAFANYSGLSGDAYWHHVFDMIAPIPELCRLANIGLESIVENDTLKAQVQQAEAREKAARIEGLREGFDLAEENAEVSDSDGWHKLDPFIDWDIAYAARDRRIRELEGEGKT